MGTLDRGYPICACFDRFEVEGIGHNLPFLAVMDHPKFISGDNNAFIAEEYPDGFQGAELNEAELRRIAARCCDEPRCGNSPYENFGPHDNHERRVGDNWVVSLQGEKFAVSVAADANGSTVTFEDGASLRVEGDWTPGMMLADMTVDGTIGYEGGKITGGFRIRNRVTKGACAFTTSGGIGAAHDRKTATRHIQNVAVPDAGLIVKGR